MKYQNRGGIIAAGNESISEAGKQMFELGGNAFDAAVAACWATFVAEPHATSAGGGGFLNAYTASGKSVLYDFFAQTPSQKRGSSELNFYPVTIHFGDSSQVFHGGLGSMAVPGNVAGLFHVHRQLGKLPLKEVMRPAIELAKKGVEISDYFRWALDLIGPIMTSLPSGRELLEPHGKPLNVGEFFSSAQMAATFEALATEGERLFYEGEIALQAVQDCAEKGGHLIMDDFRNYAVIERNPLRVMYRHFELLTNPPPSAGGSLVAFTLKLLEAYDLKKEGFGSAMHLQALVNAMRATRLSRKETLDPQLYAPHVIEAFFDENYLTAQRQKHMPSALDFWGSTTHVSTADYEGNIASVTTSVGAGCGYAISGTGIMMNNMLGEADLNPEGFHLWKEGQRITSMMSPTLLIKDGKPRLATGTGGANRIRSTVAQVISNVIDFGMSPAEAVEAPRIHYDEPNGTQHVDIEPGFSQTSIDQMNVPGGLQKTVFKQKAFYFGGAHTVFETADGHLDGIGDGRRAGTVQKVKLLPLAE